METIVPQKIQVPERRFKN